ncbi:MAG TPA: chemotaxis protein CheB [Methylophilus sp.]|uniref:chemotaxis protein CheB n=1 Tax=Methylophilus sp. TaxID=29541 RepID=UPI002C4BA023|nr:chemotaxis protein CheB [Methylophilus sp.]HSH86975.1 chemotaxis protein CheB [Methylophilus sp.]
MESDGKAEKRLQAIKAVVVGASAGGIEAMMQLFCPLPPDYPVPIICVIHLPDHHESNLAEVFQQWTRIKVQDAEDKATIMNGRLYFAPAGYHLLVEEDGTFSLSCEGPVNYSRPSIDLLMQTAALAYGPGLLGILLTGANMDGALGMKTIKQHGGFTVVQAPLEAKSGTMPSEAIKLQTPDLIAGLSGIKQRLLQLGEGHAGQ